jgi:hypothetical protein
VPVLPPPHCCAAHKTMPGGLHGTVGEAKQAQELPPSLVDVPVVEAVVVVG